MGRSDLADMYARAEGAQHPRASADISGKSRLPMLHMLCNTSSIRKIALHYIP